MHQFKKFDEIADSRELSNNILERDIRWGEVKLFQYLVLGIINKDILDSNQINYHELELLEQYRSKGYLTYEFVLDKLIVHCTDEFEDFMFEMLELAYKK